MKPPFTFVLHIPTRASSDPQVPEDNLLRRRVPFAFGVGVIAPYPTAFVLVLVGPLLEDHWHRQRFTPTGWRTADTGNVLWPTRLTMVEDLRAHPLSRGISRDSVERLIGPGDSTPMYREWDLVYPLGPDRSMFRMDSEWLVIRFDSAGRVSDHQLVRD